MRIENSFIPVDGVGEKTEQKLWNQGITHWEDFRPDAVGSTRANRIEAFIEDAQDRLASGNVSYFGEVFPSQSRWRLYENFYQNACFFDIETTGLDQRHDKVTTVSLRQGDHMRTLVRGEDLSAQALRDAFAGSDLLVSFNGKRFDVPFLKQSFDLDGVLNLPHLDLMYPTRRLGLTGGLKQIEMELGIERDRPDLSGKDAVRLWYEYQRGEKSALETLVSYNREDVDHLERVAEEVIDRLHCRVVPDACDF